MSEKSIAADLAPPPSIYNIIYTHSAGPGRSSSGDVEGLSSRSFIQKKNRQSFIRHLLVDLYKTVIYPAARCRGCSCAAPLTTRINESVMPVLLNPAEANA